MAITLNGTTGITTPDLTSAAPMDVGGSAVLTAASSLAAANLTGVLPAISGAALTNLPIPASAVTLISTTTVSTSVGTVDIAIPTSGYSFYRMIVTNLTTASDAGILVRTSSDGGSTFASTSGDYNNENNAGAHMYLANANSQYGDADARKGSNIENTFINTAGFYFKFATEISYYRSSDASAQYYSGPVSGVRNSATQVNALRYFVSPGNITGGTFKLYGYT